jgi:hypothetical protein
MRSLRSSKKESDTTPIFSAIARREKPPTDPALHDAKKVDRAASMSFDCIPVPLAKAFTEMLEASNGETPCVHAEQ